MSSWTSKKTEGRAERGFDAKPRPKTLDPMKEWPEETTNWPLKTRRADFEQFTKRLPFTSQLGVRGKAYFFEEFVMNRYLLLAATVSVALTLTASAEAKVYDWSYTLTNGQGRGSGTFNAGAALPDLITDATGIISSDPGFGVGFTVTGISGYAGADNTIYALGFDDNQVSLGGISLATSAGDINIFYLNGAPGVTNSVQNPGGGLVALYAGDLSVTAVPEPSTWAMMLLGSAGLGFAGYRRARTGRAALV